MFYSQLLLSKKKGGLGIVWLAAHCLKRLKKDQVHHTNISSSVDKILDNEVHVVTHRILAFLLLGVVRIYSKKVEYLFRDCHQVLDKLCGVRAPKDKRADVGISQRRYYSITLPKTFELDAFDLELLEDQDLVGGNKRSHQLDMLADGCGKDGNGTSGLCFKEKMPFSEALTPPRDVFSSHNMYQDMFVGPSSKVSHRVSFSLEDRLDPIVLDDAENEQMKIKLSNEDMTTNDMGSNTFGGLLRDTAPSVEILRGTAFSLEDSMDTMVLDEVEKEQLNDNRPSNDNISLKSCELVQDSEFVSAANQSPLESDSVASLGVLHKCVFPFQHSPSFRLSDEPSGKEHKVEEEHAEHLRSRLNIQEDDLTESVDIVSARPMRSEKLNVFEVVTPENMKPQRPKEVPMSVLTTDSKHPGHGSPDEVVNVKTPAKKERGNFLKKRKILYDSTTMVSNKVLKNWLDDPSGLQREKGNVPHTLLHAWRARKLGHVPGSFFEPFIAVTAVDLGDLESKIVNVAIKSMELATGQDDIAKSPAPRQDDVVKSPPPPPVVVTHEEDGDIRSPLELPPQSPIAPGTPVTRLKSSVRSHEAGAVADSPTFSSQSVEKSTSSIQWDFEIQEETNSYEGGEYQGKGMYSERTRMMGSYLEKKFLGMKKQNKGEQQALNLSQLLAGKTKRESARLFYEILVLKTLDLIDVEQENAYHDILLRETKHTSSFAIDQN